MGFEAPAFRRDGLLARGFIWRGDIIASAKTSPNATFLAHRKMTASVAIIDYGSGNLRSAAKAFERSVRALRAETEVRGHLRSRRWCAAPTASFCPASAPSRTA